MTARILATLDLIRLRFDQWKGALPAPPPPPSVENAALRAPAVHDPGEELSQKCASAQYRHNQQHAQNRLCHGDYRRGEGVLGPAESERRELDE